MVLVTQDKNSPDQNCSYQDETFEDEPSYINMNLPSTNNSSSKIKPEHNRIKQSSITTKIAILCEKMKAFKNLALPYFYEDSNGRWLLGSVVLFLLLISFLVILFSFIGRDFWSALSNKDEEQFRNILMLYSLALLAGTPISVLFSYYQKKLALAWREWMTKRVMNSYYANRMYYNLERSGYIDNPDQRISQDINNFTTYSLSLFIITLRSVIDLVAFSFILLSIQPSLFLTIITYAIFGTLVTVMIGKKLMNLNFLQLKKEADFRYSLVRLRENAESIAFYKGEEIEKKETGKRLDTVLDNKMHLIQSERNLEFFTTSYDYLIQVLPIAVIAPLYFSGAIELGVVSQTAMAFNQILNDLSLIINQFEGLASFAAGIDRLQQFMDAVQPPSEDDEIDLELGFSAYKPHNYNSCAGQKTATVNSDESIKVFHRVIAETNPENSAFEVNIGSSTNSTKVHSSSNQPLISIHNLHLRTPDSTRLLIEKLFLTLNQGENLLITGNSGTGKSSLIRAIAGLWSNGFGTIDRPPDNEVMFLPQRPYCSLGSLMDQLLYPNVSTITDEEITTKGCTKDTIICTSRTSSTPIKYKDLLQVLDAINLKNLLSVNDDDSDVNHKDNNNMLKAFHGTKDWSNILSLGEQQRLAFGRILLNTPKFIILDEATSALDIKAEKEMYALLQGMAYGDVGPSCSNDDSVPSITYLSVGHRPSLFEYHDMNLHFDGGNVFWMRQINQMKAEASPQWKCT